MQNLEKLLKKNLKVKLSDFKRTESCPSELELVKYLDDTLALSQRQEIGRHLADCVYCLDVLIVTRDILQKERVKKKGFWQKLMGQKWLALTALSFFCSFLFRRYFLQCLFLSLILGIKWALGGEGSRNLVMIFRGLKQQDSQPIDAAKNIFARK